MKGSQSKQQKSKKNNKKQRGIKNIKKIVEIRKEENEFFDDSDDGLFEDEKEELESEINSESDDDSYDDEYEKDVFEAEEEAQEDEEESKRKKKEARKEVRRQNKKINYVDPDRMMVLIKEYYETDVFSDELAEDIRKICNRICTGVNFAGYTYRDEMEAEAVYRAFMAIYNKKFNINAGFSPFSYLTQVAWHANQQVIKKEKFIRSVADEYRDANFDKFMDESKTDADPSNGFE